MGKQTLNSLLQFRMNFNLIELFFQLNNDFNDDHILIE
jgi:hypothetical protein